MTLSADPKHPSRRTFVVKVRSEATPESLSGRVENLVTCKQQDFSSADELVDVIACDIERSARETPDNQ
jgi:hypothetical protein